MQAGAIFLYCRQHSSYALVCRCLWGSFKGCVRLVAIEHGAVTHAETDILSPHAWHWSQWCVWPCRSNLVDLCQDTMMSFGHDPPLFSKGPGYSEPPPRSQPHPPSPSFQAHNPIHRCLMPIAALTVSSYLHLCYTDSAMPAGFAGRYHQGNLWGLDAALFYAPGTGTALCIVQHMHNCATDGKGGHASRPPPYSGSNVNGPSPSATPGANIWGGAVAAATGQPNLGYGPGPGPGPGRQHSPAGRLSSAQMDPPQPLRPNLKVTREPIPCNHPLQSWHATLHCCACCCRPMLAGL